MQYQCRFRYQLAAKAILKDLLILIEQQAVIFTDDLGTKSDHTDVPTGMEAEYTQHREFLIERVAETDEELTLKYLEGEEITKEELLPHCAKQLLPAH